MILTFLGTRGEIRARTRRHGRHTSLEVSYRARRVMIDCGTDWRGRIGGIHPHAIVVTHAHPDHVDGLRGGAPCAVYATELAWGRMDAFGIESRRTVEPRRPFRIGAITFEAFTVEHSLNAPAVGYRITAGKVAVFYVPDLVYIHERSAALEGIDVYIGDGASMSRPLVRRRGDALIGHASVRNQIEWCRREGVPRFIVTHCGSGIVEGDGRTIRAQLQRWAAARELRAEIAHDGMKIRLTG